MMILRLTLSWLHSGLEESCQIQSCVSLFCFDDTISIWQWSFRHLFAFWVLWSAWFQWLSSSFTLCLQSWQDPKSNVFKLFQRFCLWLFAWQCFAHTLSAKTWELPDQFSLLLPPMGGLMEARRHETSSIITSSCYPNRHHIIGYPSQEFGWPYIGLVGKNPFQCWIEWIGAIGTNMWLSIGHG